MKKFVCALFFLLGVQTLFGMQNTNWEEMHKKGMHGLHIRLKNTVDNHILNLSDMKLICIDGCDKLIPLLNEAALEVSHDELAIDLDDEVIFCDDPTIKVLSVACNPKLKTLPDCLTKFVDLEKLIISFSGIDTFQAVFFKLPMFKHLVLSRYQFNQFSEDECFKDFVIKLDFVTIEHTQDEPPLTDKAIEIAIKLTNKKLLDLW